MGATECYPDKAPRVDRLMDTLSSDLRREVVHYFENFASGRTATVEELVAHVDQRVPHRDREELVVALRHSHLPKLQARGWIDLDDRNDTVQYHGHDSVEQLLRELVEVFE